ncbi:DUF1592 domain-containing protein [Rubripirellula sp.]|nr:DUF1592 domain-containing protein [Rubripirellula sp.]MDB4419341.1 DUF1592 domain-containing protein [bacterium]MDB4621444.1 DUF1592 domain-containing protein [Rubripirellula sp.]
MAADPQIPTLAQLKIDGRDKSNFLNQDKPQPALTGVPKANLEQYRSVIQPLLKSKCLACHGPDEEHANLRIDRINPNLLTGESIERWREIYKVLSNSEMPPEDEPTYAMTDIQRKTLVGWISTEMNKASFVRRNTTDHTSFRRLTKAEYNFALQDLLGLPYAIGHRLPTETASEDGFIKNSEMLQMSAMQFSTYRELALEALRRVTVQGSRPTPIVYDISMQDEMNRHMSAKNAKVFKSTDDDFKNQQRRQHFFNPQTGDGVAFSNGNAKPITHIDAQPIPEESSSGTTPGAVLVMGPSNETKWNLDRFLPDEGTMRVSIRTGRTTMNPNEHTSLRLIFSAHTSNNANFSAVISDHDLPVTASVTNPQYVHFDIPLSEIQRNPFRKLETTFPRRDEFLHIRNVSNARNSKEPLKLHIDSIQVTAPYYAQWPPKSHTDIFFSSDVRGDETAYGREVLNRFLPRVWRRPVEKREVDQFVHLFERYRADMPTFEEAMLEVLATALATPEFLYVVQYAGENDQTSPNRISNSELATRLSLFLWSSIPDDELLRVAKEGSLTDPAITRQQVQRMLADPKAKRFHQNFVSQWLGLDGLNSVTHIKDPELLSAMEQEPIAFFEHLLTRNGSALDFLHSEYVLVNERLARHYGVRDVFGPHFQRVDANSANQRGGLLTGAAVMAMNSDGSDSNPLKRGVWLLERILDDPPPPPPADVPEVDLTDPRILEMTLKERILDHRNQAACISCHSRIDPWGIAFENYDALGSFRTHVQNVPIDATSTLFNKQSLAGIDGLKSYLLSERQDQFTRAIVHKMTSYALGRPLTFSDRADVDKLATNFRKSGDRMEDLIHIITGSEIFNAKQATGSDDE